MTCRMSLGKDSDGSLLSLFMLQFNFVGKLLGPRGNSLKRLQEDTLTKMSILGKGSMRDKEKVTLHSSLRCLPYHNISLQNLSFHMSLFYLRLLCASRLITRATENSSTESWNLHMRKAASTFYFRILQIIFSLSLRLFWGCLQGALLFVKEEWTAFSLLVLLTPTLCFQSSWHFC